jgi:hypothetical protein
MSESDRALREAVRRLRRGLRNRVLLEGAVRVLAAGLLALLLGAVLTASFGAGSNAVATVRVIGYLLIAAALLRYLVLPALRRPDDAQLALYAEERAPELQQALVSAVHELGIPEEARPSPALAARVVSTALAEVQRLEAGPGLERPRIRRAAGWLGAFAATAAALVLAGPQILRDTARVLFIPWAEAAAAPVFLIQVQPGNAAVPRGGAIQIRAALHGFASEGAELVMRADTASDWVRLPMLRDSAAAEFTARLFDLTRATEYFVEADGVKSPAFRLTVTDLPAVQRLSLELKFPAYTGLPPEKIEQGGDVAAVVGTSVMVRATVTRPAKSVALHLDGGPTVPLTRDSLGRWSGGFQVKRDGFYQVDLVAPDGTQVPGAVQYVIEALEDRIPTVTIEQPGRDTKVTSVEEISIALRAEDDYGVGRLELRYSVNGGAEQRIALTDTMSRRTTSQIRAAHTLFLEELGLKPGDLIAYHGVARDGAGGSGSSDIYFLEVRPFGRDYRQAESGPPGGGGGGAQSPEGLSARQREIVAGTFNTVRDSARNAERQRREDLTTLAIAQGKLKQDVAGLVRRLVERNVVASDTAFVLIHAELDTASREMQAAEEGLGKGAPREALPPEQRALQRLQRAEAVYRDVQVQMGNQGGGGGGNNARAEDLADLFELENDKLRNQYESVQREQSQSAEQQVDEAAERLRQLASRQQQENERMQRMAEELRAKTASGNSGGGGGGGSAQRELARQTEEEARRLERLARERNEPQLAEAARKLQEAADAMRRAASGSSGAQSQGGSALDRLRNAARELENARASRQSEGIRGLQRRAEELNTRQREVAEGVDALPQAGALGDKAERLRRLDEKKDALASDVERLQADAERIAREARGDQPGAAGKVAQAADAMQQARLRDRILYSKDVMRGNSPEYAKRFEEQISENLGNVSARLREAAGAISESAQGKGDRALQRARELVQGLESLRERMEGRKQGAESRPEAARESAQRQQGQGQGQQGQGQGQGGGGQQGGRQNSGGQMVGSPTGGGGNGSLDPGAARQFSREFRLRREAAESLRRELSQQSGVDLRELDRAIADLRQLESGRRFGDPKGLEELQAAVIEGLKTWEFRLFRALGQTGENRPALGAPSQAPAEYRALVEEYYRSLGRPKPPK